MINENSKSFLTKQVDLENKEGSFESYKRLVSRIWEMIEAVAPHYRHPKTLASTIVETALYQHFLSEHFKNVTDTGAEGPKEFLIDLVNKTLL